MRVFKTQEEVDAALDGDRNLIIHDVIRFECDVKIAGNIDAVDIVAGNIDAVDIDANDISYYAFCNVYENINCYSISGRRENHAEPVCLDGKLTIRKTKKPKKAKG